ncbi:MAG: hypothetical protein A2623_09520 [Caulobacterales bacterium RIFCSPHIGHO2_01_FULL_70_19]|nr:MAG: hypothetical protein A2623_09520 [Caulobacterales bacterium RIFCSPHIGHO2_01_FULL_70_19]
MTTIGIHPSAVIAQRAVIAEQEEAVRLVDGRINELRARADAAQSSFDELVAERNERNLQATLAGDSLPPEDPTEGKRLRKYQAEIAAANEAIQVLTRDRAGMMSELPQLRRELANQFLAWKGLRLHAALETSKACLSTLQAPLAELFALDALQLELLGPVFQTGPAVEPNSLISGSAIATSLVKALPHRVAPGELGPEALDEAARTSLNLLKAEIAQ